MHGWPSAAGFLTALVLAHAQSCVAVCVVIPEEDRCIVPRPVPDVACEMVIIRELLSYSFHVVDQTQVKFLRIADQMGNLWRAAAVWGCRTCGSSTLPPPTSRPIRNC